LIAASVRACSDASVKPLDSLGLCTRWRGPCFAWCLHSLYPMGPSHLGRCSSWGRTSWAGIPPPPS